MDRRRRLTHHGNLIRCRAGARTSSRNSPETPWHQRLSARACPSLGRTGFAAARNSPARKEFLLAFPREGLSPERCELLPRPDRKSTRLNSSHLGISYAVFCLKKKKK